MKVKKLHKLLKQRQDEILKSDIGTQAIFAMRLAHYKNAFMGVFPIDFCAEEWRESKNELDKKIYAELKRICNNTPGPEPKVLSRIGCVTCGAMPFDAKLRGLLES